MSTSGEAKEQKGTTKVVDDIVDHIHFRNDIMKMIVCEDKSDGKGQTHILTNKMCNNDTCLYHGTYKARFELLFEYIRRIDNLFFAGHLKSMDEKK